MTEDEAKKKWCPQTLHARLMVADHVPQPVEIAGATCIGSVCMAWRWLKEEAVEKSKEAYQTIKERQDDEGEYVSAPRPEGQGWAPQYVETWSKKHGGPRSHVMHWERRSKTGFCGLAGAPHA